MLCGVRRKLPYVATTLGERIKERRMELGVSQAELARQVGVKPQAVTQWESGATKSLRPENLLRTRDVLGTTVDWLVYGRDPQGPRAEIREAPPPYTADILRLARAIESLSALDRAHLQAVADAFAKSAPWDELTERRGGKEGKG